MNKSNILKLFTIFFLIFVMLIANINNNKKIGKIYFINKLIPHNLGEWEGKDLKPDKKVFNIINADELLIREYSKKNMQKIYLAIVLSNDITHVHDPEICYRLQGFVFKSKNKIKVSPEITGSYILAEKNKQQYCFIYWYTDLNKSFSNRFKFMQSIIWSKFINKPIKGYGIFVIYCPKKDFEELIKFSNSVNKILLNKV